jgi:dsRNA-specific ribonuclease
MLYDDDIVLKQNAEGQEITIFDPYNPLNKLIEKEDIENILRTFGINEPIHNIELYRRAFVHRSYIKRPLLSNNENNIIIIPKPDDCIPLYTKSNERLEYLGDGLLECITKYYLYCRFLKKDEGFMTEKKIALVKNESIGKIAMEIGLHKWFILSKHAENKNIRNNLKKLGCLFEAFLGAIFLDFNKQDYEDDENNTPIFELIFSAVSGFKSIQTFIKNVFEKHVDWVELIQTDNNYKNILQVILQKEFKITPQYLEIKKHDKEEGYNMGVYLCLSNNKLPPLSFPNIGNVEHARDIQIYFAGNEVNPNDFHSFKDIHDYYEKHHQIFLLLGQGIHTTKKEAEQMACENAIKYINNWNNTPLQIESVPKYKT